jgi:hypothetical protein
LRSDAQAIYRLTSEDRKAKKMPWLASSTVSPHEVDAEDSLPYFALRMLSRLIVADEFHMQRRSDFRIFLRMDISVFKREGKFHYMVNELTSSQHTALFLQWSLKNMDYCLQDLSLTLHFVAQDELSKRTRMCSPSI